MTPSSPAHHAPVWKRAAPGHPRHLALVDLVRPSHKRPALSPREVEVLRAWFASDSKTTVAANLAVSLGTVNTHLSRVRSKYAAVGRAAPTKAALVARALQDGLIDLDEL
ncbi:LuxR C-terminal-related transcriptional regulator [Hoyosella sp. YIM 151337]|uniref:LuxR C-terminal-related transcriptional regulator n=1 Tax=Hoyosella sp. YIM 151337 TaxID=2992742 RepID=UPI002235ECDF|nr:LuxR C-terminal-related transcriptional regulator [Hoyosella sp. YIM 151337]MCW4354835.1 LuxR C-terminal-related transcriptional regulator [Hoyosella sp. YIM 151337]